MPSSLTSKIFAVGALALLASAVIGSMPAAPAAAARGGWHAARRVSAGHELARTRARPPGRQIDSLAFDPRHDDLVLFGGQTASAVLGDTWILHDGIWTKRDPARAPSARTGAALVYDRATRQLLLFGGSSKPAFGGGFSSQTWVWTGTTWRRLHPATSPSPRHNANLIYDAASHNVILFGGFGGKYLNDTWAWNGSTWTQLHPATSPSPRDSDALVYDPASKTAILYGGFSLATGRLTDTWAWNGTTWTQLHPATTPGRTSVFWQAGYDAASRQMLLFGGERDHGRPAEGTWTWTGTAWRRLTPALNPPELGGGSMTYDSGARQLFLFGGFTNVSGGAPTQFPNATWTWNGKIWNLQRRTS